MKGKDHSKSYWKTNFCVPTLEYDRVGLGKDPVIYISNQIIIR